MPNPTTSRFSLKSVEPSIARQLQSLHQLDRRWNWVCLLYPVLWIASVALMVAYPVWWVMASGVLVIAVSIQAMAILMHEALHGNLFRDPLLDRWAAFLLGVPAFFSGCAYRVVHLHHHRNTRTGEDPDEISNLVRTASQYRTLFFSWFVVGTPLYMLIVPWKALGLARTSVRRRIVMEYIAIFIIYGLVVTGALVAGHGGGCCGTGYFPQ